MPSNISIKKRIVNISHRNCVLSIKIDQISILCRIFVKISYWWLKIFFFFFTFVKPRRSNKARKLSFSSLVNFEGQESFVKGMVSLWSIRNLFFTLLFIALSVQFEGEEEKKRRDKNLYFYKHRIQVCFFKVISRW